jgi:hypothetical protein
VGQERKTMSESDKDIVNVQAWAEIIEDMLALMPPDSRIEVLRLAVQKEEAARKERAGNPYSLHFMDAVELQKYKNSPGFRHWNAIMRLKSLVVQVFVRDITNDHSPADAAKILFAHHRHGHGSGRLGDYLDNGGSGNA